MLFCQLAWLFVVGGYKTQGVFHQGFAVFHATLGHFMMRLATTSRMTRE